MNDLSCVLAEEEILKYQLTQRHCNSSRKFPHIPRASGSVDVFRIDPTPKIPVCCRPPWKLGSSMGAMVAVLPITGDPGLAANDHR